MTTLLRIDLPSAGPFGAQMSEAYAHLAASITTEPGLLWKLWTENATQQTAGGIYLFSDEASAQAQATMHTKRLEAFGVTGVRARFVDVNKPLTAMTRGPAT